MGFFMSSISPCELKSVSLRTIEEFVRLCDDVTKARRLHFKESPVLDECCFSFQLWDLSLFAGPTDSKWKRFQDRICDVVYQMKRAEMTALVSEVVARIMLQFEQEIFPALRGFLRDIEANGWLGTHLQHMYHLIEQPILLEDLLKVFIESVSSGLESAYKLVVPSLVLLSFVYQYLIGCVDKGGSKTYSPGSFLFRLIFVAIVLFLGSYVWIKFREASYTASRRKRKLRDESDVPGGVYRRAVKNTSGVVTHFKYEPRFKPLREKLESGASQEFNCLSLGSYDNPREAEIVRHIAVVLYGEDEGRPVEFEDGLCLPFPSMTELEKCPPCGKEKAVWVTRKTKELYAELLKEKANRRQLLHPAVERGTHHGHGAPSSAMESINLPSPHGSSGVIEKPTTSECHGVGQEPLLAREVFPAYFSDCDFDQFVSSMPQLEENDLPAMHDLDKGVGDNSETDRSFGYESTLVPPQSSAFDHLTPAIFGSLPQLGVGDQGFETVEPHLNSATAITVRQLESLPEQVQLRKCVIYQEQRPERFSVSNVELLQKLRESEERNYELQQNLLESKDRNSELQQNLLEFKDRNSELQQNLLEFKDRNSELQQNLLESKDRISELQQNLLESKDRNSGLQQKLRKAEVENEKWRSMSHQVAKLMAASNLSGYPVDIQ